MTFAITTLIILAIIAVPAVLSFAAIGRWTKLAFPMSVLVSAGVAGPLPIVGFGLLIDMEQGFCCREQPVTFWSALPTYVLYWGMAAAIALATVLIAHKLGMGKRSPVKPDQSVFD